jgi:predicted RNase H-like HicB family nuclease
MRRYLVVIEKARRGFSAYSPDLPGCVAAAATRAGTERAMRAAIAMHLEALRAEGAKPPTPRASSTYVEVTA